MIAAEPARLCFLPGASGDADFWRPVSERLIHFAERLFLGWPGFDPTPVDATVNGLDDLASLVARRLDCPTALFAQSMGGAVAIRAARRKPEWVTHLVLAATSGGLDVSALGGQDWRPSLRASHPDLPSWFADDRRNLESEMRSIDVPVLLIWGDADPISPVAVGRRLASLFPRASLHVEAGAGHDVAHARAAAVAPIIARHLASKTQQPTARP